MGQIWYDFQQEAADRLRCPVRSLDRLWSQRSIKAVKVRGPVRINDAEPERFITTNTATTVK
jgi:excisionase family DNA binding protein